MQESRKMLTQRENQMPKIFAKRTGFYKHILRFKHCISMSPYYDSSAVPQYVTQYYSEFPWSKVNWNHFLLTSTRVIDKGKFEYKTEIKKIKRKEEKEKRKKKA